MAGFELGVVYVTKDERRVQLHELSIVFAVVRTVERLAKQNGLTKIDTLVLQIGELSSVVPRYIEECYPAAVHGTMMQDTTLRIEMLPGNAMCKQCKKAFNLIKNDGRCPDCGSKDCEILSGKEFMIKEIVAC